MNAFVKPSWEDAPFWANWLAMDRCGVWFWYEDKPVQVSDEVWDTKELCRVNRAESIRRKGNPYNWKTTLEERP